METSTKIEALDVLTPHHLEHTSWMNELKFFTDEVNIYEHQLEKLVKNKKNKKDMLPRLEQFQNNFIRQKEVLDQLKHDIKVHEQRVAWSYQIEESIKQKFLKEHDKIAEDMTVFRKIFLDLKKDFYKFLKQWK